MVPVESGTRTLKDATNEAMRDWVTNVPTTHYIIGSVVGPDPFPRMVRDFQSVIGREARAQMLARYGRLPHTVVACVGGGSNAMGIFSGFLDDPEVQLVGVEAAGKGIATGHHSATLTAGTPGRAARQPELSAAGRRRPGVPRRTRSRPGWITPASGPEHSYLRDTGRVHLRDGHRRRGPRRLPDALPARRHHSGARDRRMRSPGSARSAGSWPRDASVLVCLSGRGDKDVAHVADLLGARRDHRRLPPQLLPASQVSELIQVVAKALRAFQMYLPNNPIYQRAIQNVRAAFQPIWAATDELVLQWSRPNWSGRSRWCTGRLNKSESLAWSLFKDGMRELTMHKGAEEEELPRLLATINQARFLPTDAGDDLLTLLWAHEFQLIQYHFVDFFGEGGGALPEASGRLPAASRLRRNARRRRRGSARRGPKASWTSTTSTPRSTSSTRTRSATSPGSCRRSTSRDVRASALDVLFDLMELNADGRCGTRSWAFSNSSSPTS